MIKRMILAIAVICITASSAEGRGFAVKTNLLYDSALTANIGAEFTLAPRWSLNLPLSYNGWSYPGKGHIYRNAVIQPEARSWFCESMIGPFVGMHVHVIVVGRLMDDDQIGFLCDRFSDHIDSRRHRADDACAFIFRISALVFITSDGVSLSGASPQKRTTLK